MTKFSRKTEVFPCSRGLKSLMSADCCLEIAVFPCNFSEVWLVLLTEQLGLQLTSVSVTLDVVLYSEVKGQQLSASEMRSVAVAIFLSCCLLAV